ncbi:MAG: phospholipase D-like domain-containing protein [Acidimicrobiales bacterium]
MTRHRIAAVAFAAVALVAGPSGAAFAGAALARPGGTPAPELTATVVSAPLVAITTLGLIAEARHSIELEMYELGNPAIVSALESARRRGVTVRVVSDPTEYQSQASDAELARSGVMVRKLAVRGGIDHVKLLVVDDARVLVGGVNLGAASSYTTDADVELSGPAVRDAALLFARDWAAAGGSGTPASGAFGPFVTGTAILPAMLAVIAHAAGRCTVVANYLSDYSIQDALVAAERRGVAVTVVLNRTGYGEASAAAWLRRGGVHVELAPADPYLHAKILACGGKAMIGSANFSYDAMAVNHEIDVVLGGGAAATVGAFATGIARADA